ncbi:hypothetical protein I6N95_04725 [Vagococcus sp. BWB3-3]|uniref:Uncharacterized protein n=1 Tax=Vagococcus allomyrinae TaxID=2794353 RepID=A0A940PCP3_9ENTE|nr:hypothetical protein [Vagococcus allomyrinae]MBP1040313.1 hypothetical protein [Vagococcus allomyrinae]
MTQVIILIKKEGNTMTHDPNKPADPSFSYEQQLVDQELSLNYAALLELNRLLLKQVDSLNQSFRGMMLANQTVQSQQGIILKVMQTLEVCDRLRSAADSGQDPTEVMQQYMLTAKDPTISTGQEVQTRSDEQLRVASQVSRVSAFFLPPKAEKAVITSKEPVPLVSFVKDKQTELHVLETSVNEQLKLLRTHFDKTV